MQPPAQTDFLDVPALLEQSQPRLQAGWFWYAAGAFLLIVLFSSFASTQSPVLEAFVQVLSALSMVGVIAAMMLLTWLAVRRQRGEMLQLEAISELVQLRRWSEAAFLLRAMLSQPTRTPAARVQGLIFLTAVLARYHRFTDAILVQEHLLDHVNLDESTAQALRLGRAMAMLREDRLFDADRAIAELRRLRQGTSSAGLALVEIYRDVKTGHPDEAIEIFDANLPAMREQLGHRVGDAWALAARAYDLLGRESEARRAFERATVLSPIVELLRRYPEIAPLVETFTPAPAPAEVA
jgi:tetratricopeptide (TPR) repeat protein